MQPARSRSAGWCSTGAMASALDGGNPWAPPSQSLQPTGQSDENDVHAVPARPSVTGRGRPYPVPSCLATHEQDEQGCAVRQWSRQIRKRAFTVTALRPADSRASCDISSFSFAPIPPTSTDSIPHRHPRLRRRRRRRPARDSASCCIRSRTAFRDETGHEWLRQGGPASLSTCHLLAPTSPPLPEADWCSCCRTSGPSGPAALPPFVFRLVAIPVRLCSKTPSC